jgi:hypothetical protein
MKKKYGKVDKEAIEKLKKVQHMGNVDRNALVKVGHGKLHVESVGESARSDAMRAIRKDKDLGKGSDVDGDDDSATDADIKGASKNILMQMRKALNLGGKFEVEFLDKKKVKIKPAIANAFIKKLYFEFSTQIQCLSHLHQNVFTCTFDISISRIIIITIYINITDQIFVFSYSPHGIRTSRLTD